jgi:hypothetical protein
MQERDRDQEHYEPVFPYFLPVPIIRAARESTKRRPCGNCPKYKRFQRKDLQSLEAV